MDTYDQVNSIAENEQIAVQGPVPSEVGKPAAPTAFPPPIRRQLDGLPACGVVYIHSGEQLRSTGTL